MDRYVLSDLASHPVSRRQVLAGWLAMSVGVLAACTAAPSSQPAPTPPVTAASPSPVASAASLAAPAAGGVSPVPSQSPAVLLSPVADWQAAWNQTVAAAQQEGHVSVATTSGEQPPKIFQVFQDKYGISVDVLGESAGSLLLRVKTERQAGQYLYDVSLNSTNTTIVGYKPIGGLDLLAPAFILPDITQDASWIDGFAAGWADTGKTLDYSSTRLAEQAINVNRQVVPESQLSHIAQLWDPQWKGMISMGDTRLPTTATPMLGAWILTFGEDKVREFLQNQQPVVSDEPRQLAQWLVQGQYPICFGVGVTDLQFLASEGLDLSAIQPLAKDDPGGVVADDGTGSVALFSNAPHPNAAKVLINWLLSQEGQVAVSTQTGYNSRRTDVQPVDPSTVIDPSKTYPSVQTEDTYPVFQQAIAISKELLQ